MPLPTPQVPQLRLDAHGANDALPIPPPLQSNEAWSGYWLSTEGSYGPRWDLWNFPVVHAAG
jgi:hypothetical protein